MNRANRAVSRARLLEDESAAAEVDRLASRIRDDVRGRLHRRGVVVGCSGGVDSSVVLALCVRALGPDGVLALLMPERESSPESVVLASEWAIELGTAVVTEDVTAALEGAGCYRRRDEAIARLFPEFDSRWKSKISLPGGLLEEGTLNVFNLTVIDPAGGEHSVRIPPGEFAQIVAASNFKQRTRMAMLYYHAEMCNYAVAGTGNRDEHELGFFVKYGDGGADLAPILHLYKVEIYRLAEALDVPEPIRRRTPTSDTYSAGSSQEEFFFRLPFDVLDPIWALNEGGVSAETIAVETGFTVEQVGRVVQDIARKRRSTEYLRTPPITYPRQATE